MRAVDAVFVGSIGPSYPCPCLGCIDGGGNFWLFGGDGIDSTGLTWDLNDLWRFQPSTTPVSTITSVSVVCSPASILTTQTSTCTPTVSGTGTYSSSVTWSVSPSSVGTVSSGGVFTPSASGTATITATSTQDTTKSEMCIRDRLYTMYSPG